MSFSFAAIPMPVLIGIPVVGLIAGAVYFEWHKHQAAAAVAAAPATSAAPATTAAPGSTAAGPLGLTAPIVGVSMAAMPLSMASLASLAVLAAAPHTAIVPLRSAPQPHTVIVPMKAGPTAPPKPHVVIPPMTPIAPPSPAPSDPTLSDLLTQAAQVAQQILTSLPSPFPGDTLALNEHIVRAALSQFVASPTVAQLQATLAALQQNGTSSTGSSIALDAYNTLNAVGGG